MPTTESSGPLSRERSGQFRRRLLDVLFMSPPLFGRLLTLPRASTKCLSQPVEFSLRRLGAVDADDNSPVNGQDRPFGLRLLDNDHRSHTAPLLVCEIVAHRGRANTATVIGPTITMVELSCKRRQLRKKLTDRTTYRL